MELKCFVSFDKVTLLRRLFVAVIWVFGLPAMGVTHFRINESVECESLLNPENELSSNIRGALATFPNIDRPMFPGFLQEGQPDHELFKSALNQLPQGIETVGIESITGGIFNWPFDYKRLLGLPIAGYFVIPEQYYAWVPADQIRYRYLAGTIVGLKSVWPVDHYDRGVPAEEDERKRALYRSFILIVDTPLGIQEVAYEIGSARTHLYILQQKTTAEEKLNIAFLNSRYDDWISNSFGSPIEPSDYEVASQALHLYFSLPSSYGIPATVNTLRGQKEATRSHPLYGHLYQSKRYTTTRLTQFLKYAQEFAHAQGVEANSPLYIKELDIDLAQRQVSPLVANFLKLIDDRKISNSSSFVPKIQIFTVKDYEKAAKAKVDFVEAERITQLLILASRENSIPDTKVEVWRSVKPNRLRLVSKRKTELGTRYRYTIDAESTLHFDASIPKDGIKHTYWIELVPVLEITFGANPSEILNVELTWSLSGGKHRSIVPILPIAESLRGGIESLINE